jgi:hypothetical protein
MAKYIAEWYNNNIMVKVIIMVKGILMVKVITGYTVKVIITQWQCSNGVNHDHGMTLNVRGSKLNEDTHQTPTIH